MIGALALIAITSIRGGQAADPDVRGLLQRWRSQCAAAPGGAPLYPGPLTLHLLSVELLLVWFPFGKLMHAVLVFPGRMQLGAMLARRGVRP